MDSVEFVPIETADGNGRGRKLVDIFGSRGDGAVADNAPLV